MKKNKKLLLIISLCFLILSGFTFTNIFAKKDDNNDVIKREYKVEKGEITVGIDSTGTVKSSRQKQFIEDNLVIEEYLVSIGDYVKVGDKIAKVSLDGISSKLNEALSNYKKSKDTYDKSLADLQVFELEMKLKIDDIRGASLKLHEEKARDINKRIKNLKDKNATLDIKIKNLEKEIKRLEGLDIGWPDTLIEIKRDIEEIEEEIDRYNNLINGSNDPVKKKEWASIIQALNADLEDLNKQKNEIGNGNFTGQIATLENQISDLRSEATINRESIEEETINLNTLISERFEEERRENEKISVLEIQNKANHNSLIVSSDIANLDLKEHKKKYDTLLAYQKNPIILAEFVGVVLANNYKPGDVTNIFNPLVEVGENDIQTLSLAVDPLDINNIEPNQLVSFYVDAYPQDTFFGVVDKLSYIQNDNGKFSVNVSIDQSETPLYEGMAANVTIIIKQKKDILKLNNKAIYLKDNKQYVMLKDLDGSAHEVEVTTGFSDGRFSEILSGLSENDTVVSEN